MGTCHPEVLGNSGMMRGECNSSEQALDSEAFLGAGLEKRMWEERGVPLLGNPWDSKPEGLGMGSRMMQKREVLLILDSF